MLLFQADVTHDVRPSRRLTMSLLTFTVGAPVMLDEPPFPIEGARAIFDDDTLQVVIVYEDPTPAEIAAVDCAPVKLGLYHRDRLAALVVRIGEPTDPGFIETYAPFVLSGYAIQRCQHRDKRPDLPECVSVEIALCQAQDIVLRATRRFDTPPALVGPVRRAMDGHAEPSAAQIRASEHALRHHTASVLMRDAITVAQIPPP